MLRHIRLDTILVRIVVETIDSEEVYILCSIVIRNADNRLLNAFREIVSDDADNLCIWILLLDKADKLDICRTEVVMGESLDFFACSCSICQCIYFSKLLRSRSCSIMTVDRTWLERTVVAVCPVVCTSMDKNDVWITNAAKSDISLNEAVVCPVICSIACVVAICYCST